MTFRLSPTLTTLTLLSVVPLTLAEDIRFSRDILPLLSDTCFNCHGPDEHSRKGGLRLDLQDKAFSTGKSGETAIVPGDPAKSEILRRIFSTDPDEVMPPPKALRRLSPPQKELLQRWVQAGAPWGKHWAYEPAVKPDLPAARDAQSAPAHPVDAFVAARLDQAGLKPSPEAPPETLIRRLSLDLTGLPPTPAEVDAFLADTRSSGSQRAYERLVDTLLASPRFGERWAWDWLDAARYADTNGFQGDPERTMWPWRDWVINAFNTNLPYDQFTVAQLAGDLLPHATRDQQLASGFHRNNMHNGEGGRIAEETRVENVFDRVETTGTLWLGSTFNCCRCHDHKYDPIRQRDYFALYDIFNQMSETGAGRGGQAPPVLDYSTPAEAERLKQAQDKLAAVVKQVEAFELTKFPRPKGAPLLESAAAKLPGNLSATLAARKPAQRGVDAILEAIGYFETDGKDPAYTAVLKKHLAAVRQRDTAQSNITRVMIMDQIQELRDTFILDKGGYDKPTPVKVTGALPAAFVIGNPSPDRANRLDLARWLVSRDNPLPARVTVNRYWQALFGTGLVKTAEDFGLQGEKPSHPELLDWLAVAFMDSGWDLKALLRLIVTSQTYRQSSKVTPALLDRDPDNRLLARGPRHRMPSWMLRDVALAASGLLSPQQGGPSVKPYQPPGIWEEATFGKKSYVQDHGESLYRRSLYIFWRRIVGPTMFFDNAARQVCEVKVKRTNTPLQALTTLNDITYVEAARALAQRVMLAEASADARIALAVRLVLSRAPTAPEQTILRHRLQILRDQFTADPAAATALIAVGESPRDPTLSAVDLAAHTALCQLVLNLDEALTKE
jgi:hypothetical protein